MDEIAPGLWHWTALRETIDSEVSTQWKETRGPDALEPHRITYKPLLDS